MQRGVNKTRPPRTNVVFQVRPGMTPMGHGIKTVQGTKVSVKKKK